MTVTEAEIAAVADKGPRITPERINAQIYSELYVTGLQALDAGAYVGPGGPVGGISAHTTTALGCLTICILTMRNGFTVVGKSACASPENFNETLGQRIAREDAVRQVWALEGYALRTALSEGAAMAPTSEAAEDRATA